MTAPSPAAPRVALVLKLDTLGDLVVFAPVLAALRAAWPETRLVTVIRRTYLDLAALLVPGVEWMATTIDPFAAGPQADLAEVQRLRDAVAQLQPEIVAAATSRRNWLEIALAAGAPAARRLALGDSAHDEFFATQLRLALGLDAAHVLRERVAVAADEPDWRGNFRLADGLLGRVIERTAPSLALPSEPRAAAVLAQHNLARGKYVVCAAAGFANVRIKTWPPERFAAAIAHLHERHGLPTLLVGHASEREYLEKVGRGFGPPAKSGRAEGRAEIPPYLPSLPPALWLGGDGDLPLLATLLAGSALYFGNDTGAMHLAAALDVPVLGVFGGGTWPRFVPAARRGVALVHPLPCFGCGWDCAFGDAPCLGEIRVADATAALDRTLATDRFEIMPVQHLAAETQAMMGRAAARYRASRADHLARQHKLEELTALDREKDREIVSLKQVCDEREKTIFILDGHVRNFQTENGAIKAELAVKEKTLAALPADAAKAAQTIADQVVHIRNIEALLRQRDTELAELRTSAVNRGAGLHDLEQAKHYGRLLAERDTALQSLREGCAQRESLIKQLLAESTKPTAKLYKLWRAACAFLREGCWRPFDAWLFHRVVETYWMQIGVLRHYDPRPLKWDDRLLCRAGSPDPAGSRSAAGSGVPALQIAVVTPSYGQEKFIERTLRSVLDQAYPKLLYVVQDGGSPDRSAEIIARHAPRLRHWASEPDRGQADAIVRGFAHVTPALGPDDVMAWLNSDDLLAPGALRFVGEYFARHPAVEVIYGHRIIIDDDDRDIGRWIMPRHNPQTLEWIDYVPQETLFWRKRAWDLAGGVDPSFQFALDWDLLARFQQAGCRIVRVPYFLGAFRVHAEQKTSQAIHTTGADEMRRIRTRFHGERQDDFATINRHARHTRFWGAVTARWHEIGVRW